MEIVYSKESKLPIKIKSKMANKPIVVTPDDIAEYLKYKHPDPEEVNYPEGEPLTPGLLVKYFIETHIMVCSQLSRVGLGMISGY